VVVILALTVGMTAFWYAPVLYSLGRPIYLQKFASGSIKPVTSLPNNTMSYPRLGIDAPVSISPTSSPLKTQDWSIIRQALNQGVSLSFTEKDLSSAHLAFLTGHSSDSYPHPYSSVFAGLGEAKEGDKLYLNVDGSLHTYQVISHQEIDPYDISAFKNIAPNDSNSYLAVVTCWPVLTTNKRLVLLTKLLT